MLRDVGIDYCIIGHSERRQYYHETDALLEKKIHLLHSHQIKPVLCCGEMLPEREAGKQYEIVENQLTGSLKNISAEIMKTITIAYEPVWAIGTGVTATPAQAQEMHAFIRKLIEKLFGPEIASSLRILYGGSVTPDNSAELFSMPDIDGGLVGGASLKADSFLKIISSCQ
ncbi:Triosephosphate isomerase [bioreactor metagenome]|uniref:Triosephosphate isomerase n=1 Tax=bioreactor metagenome TaxID=1076179 RepID=A0A645ENE5_9ZZZZ